MKGSSAWQGYWEQHRRGRQPMHALVLRFADGAVTGQGVDIVGRFTFQGRCEPQGAVVMVKQYFGAHQVLYRGQYDGEGTIFGRWVIPGVDSGPFLLTLAREPAAEAEAGEILEIA